MAALVRWRREGYTFEEIYWHLREYKVQTRAGRDWSLKRIQRAYQAAVRTGLVPAGPALGEGQGGPGTGSQTATGTGQEPPEPVTAR